MLSSTVPITFNFIANIVSALADTIAILICLTFLCVIIRHLIQIKCNHNSVPFDITLILSLNTLFVIIIKTTIQIFHVTIPIIMKDFQIITEYKETIFCRLCGYVFYSMVSILYWSYVLLAFFRFVRIIYPRQLWFHQSSLYFYILIPAQFVIIFIIMLPLLFILDGLHQIPNEPYCSVVLIPIYSSIYTGIIVFGLPYSVMCIFYLCIARKMRQMSLIRRYQVRNRRDYIVMRRMLLNISILSIVSIPVFGIYIINVIHDRFDSLIYRVQWLASSLSSCLFSLTLPFLTVKLRVLLKHNKSKLVHHKT